LISGFLCEVAEKCVLLGYYEVYSGISLPTFRRSISGLIAKVQEIQEESFFVLYIRGSVHHNAKLTRSNNMQQYAGIYLLQKKYMFRVSIAPIIRST
jgi:hypothetical protein